MKLEPAFDCFYSTINIEFCQTLDSSKRLHNHLRMFSESHVKDLSSQVGVVRFGGDVVEWIMRETAFSGTDSQQYRQQIAGFCSISGKGYIITQFNILRHLALLTLYPVL